MTCPQLLKAPVYVHFHSSGDGIRRDSSGSDDRECWGALKEAGAKGGAVGERWGREFSRVDFSRAREMWSEVGDPMVGRLLEGGGGVAAASSGAGVGDPGETLRRNGGGGGSGGGGGGGGEGGVGSGGGGGAGGSSTSAQVVAAAPPPAVAAAGGVGSTTSIGAGGDRVRGGAGGTGRGGTGGVKSGRLASGPTAPVGDIDVLDSRVNSAASRAPR